MSNAVLYGRGNLLRAVTYYLPHNLLRALQRNVTRKATYVRRYIFSANNLRASAETRFKHLFRSGTQHVPRLYPRLFIETLMNRAGSQVKKDLASCALSYVKIFIFPRHLPIISVRLSRFFFFACP